MGALDTPSLTYSVGEKVTAAKLNSEIRDKFADLVSAWSTYSVTVANVSGTATARYKRVGAVIHFRVDMSVSGAPTGAVSVSLPVSAKALTSGLSGVFGTIHVKDTSAGTYVQGIAIGDGTGGAITTLRLMVPASSTNTNLTQVAAAVPIPWAAGDVISVMGTYEPN